MLTGFPVLVGGDFRERLRFCLVTPEILFHKNYTVSNIHALMGRGFSR